MQAREIPEVVRVLIAHMNAGRRTYVYGTAGVNRTAYALVLMLCFFDKLDMEDAIPQAGKLRPQAKNNTDLWLVRTPAPGICGDLAFARIRVTLPLRA